MLLATILATLGVSLISFVGVLLIPAHKERALQAGISLAVGAMLAAVFLNLVPEIFSAGQPLTIKTYSLIILASIFGFFLVERLFHWHHCHCDPATCADCEDDHRHLGFINIFGDGLHNLMDGLVIGAGFVVDWRLGLISTLAVALHELPQEVGDFSVLLKAGFSRRRALAWNFVSGLLAVLGGVLAFYYANALNYQAIFLSLAAGSFLYLAMADIMPQLHQAERRHHTTQIAFIILGMLLIYLLGKFLPAV